MGQACLKHGHKPHLIPRAGQVWEVFGTGRDVVLVEAFLSHTLQDAPLGTSRLPLHSPLPSENLLLTVLAGVAGFAGGAAVSSAREALTGAGEPGAGRQTSGPRSHSPFSFPILQQEFILGSEQGTHMFSGLVSGQAHGWQSSGVPAVASP